jgi:hypothetical protein
MEGRSRALRLAAAFAAALALAAAGCGCGGGGGSSGSASADQDAGVLAGIAHALGIRQSAAPADVVQSAYSEAGKLMRADERITTLGSDVVGDRVNLYDGALQFVQTDVSLPGNSALRLNAALGNIEISLSGPCRAFDFRRDAHRYQGRVHHPFNRRFDLRKVFERLARVSSLAAQCQVRVDSASELSCCSGRL